MYNFYFWNFWILTLFSFPPDGSDWQQTDVEDLQNNKNHPRPKEPAEISRPGQNKEARLQSAGKPAIVSAKLANRPVKDLVLKQVKRIETGVQNRIHATL